MAIFASHPRRQGSGDERPASRVPLTPLPARNAEVSVKLHEKAFDIADDVTHGMWRRGREMQIAEKAVSRELGRFCVIVATSRAVVTSRPHARESARRFANG